ncbi:unnamed protein product [Pylaiella littoralis]
MWDKRVVAEQRLSENHTRQPPRHCPHPPIPIPVAEGSDGGGVSVGPDAAVLRLESLVLLLLSGCCC